MVGLAGKRVMVTGASGFIGEQLCSQLVKAGAVVTGISRTSRQVGKFEWLTCDLTNEEDVRSAVFHIEPEVIYHLASEVTGARSRELVIPCFHSNLASTVYLMTAAVDAGVTRFVQTGSQDEPDFAAGDFTPSSPYAAAKWAASAYGRMFHELYGLAVVNLRVFMVYGPGQKDLKKLIPYTTLECLAGRTPKIGIGTRKVDWVYVDDVVQAMLQAGIVPNLDGRTFEIGTGVFFTVREVVEKVARISNPEVIPFFSMDCRKMEVERAANNESSKLILGWTPQIQIEEGLRRTVESFRGNSDEMPI